MTEPTTAPAGTPHTVLEDVVGVLTGCILLGVGLVLLREGGLVTGGTAGLSLLLSYAVHVPLPVLLILVNLPFIALAAWKSGWGFALRSAATVGLVSLTSAVAQQLLHIENVDTVFAAIAANVICGVGILIIFRHKSSVGGFSVIAVMLQERTRIRAGHVLMVLDTSVILFAFLVRDPWIVALSAIGAIALSVIITMNHKPGRYTGY